MAEKIETCEGECSIVDVVLKFRYRRRDITIKARDLTEEEMSLVQQEQTTAREKAKRLLEDADETKRPKEEALFRSKDNKVILKADSLRIYFMQVAYRLGAREKVADEGWEGIDAGLVMRKQKSKVKELPVTVENLMALASTIKYEIANAVFKHFQISDVAESKN
ncbi:hypothetical protein ES703_07976 [subsurface metagenome]